MALPPPHFVTEANDWPESLQQILASDMVGANAVQVYEIRPLHDMKSVWLISSNTEFADVLIRSNGLLEISPDHPKISDLADSIPTEWKNINLDSSEFYVTPGFGSTHQEGVDLYLIARDRQSNKSVILHEWIF